MDKREEEKRKDPRKERGMVHVRAYSKSDGTKVNEHQRRPSKIKGKMKFRMDREGGRIKGRMTVYDEKGKVLEDEKIDEPFKFTEKEKKQLEDAGFG